MNLVPWPGREVFIFLATMPLFRRFVKRSIAIRPFFVLILSFEFSIEFRKSGLAMNCNPYIDPHLIGFDIDCVVADTMEAFIRLARLDYGLTIRPEQITCFEVEQCLPIDSAIVADIFERLLVDPIEAGLKPMRHAVDVLLELSGRAPLTFITARPDHEPIAQWLTHVLGPEISAAARLAAMGDHDGKARYIKDFGLSHFVDDRLETCIELARRGITPLVYHQPWNSISHDYQTVDGWQAIANLCGAALSTRSAATGSCFPDTVKENQDEMSPVRP